MVRLLVLSLVVLEIFVKWATGSWLGFSQPTKIDSQNPAPSLSWSQDPIKPIIRVANSIDVPVLRDRFE